MNKTRLALTTFIGGWSVMTSSSLAEPHQAKQQTVNPEYRRPGETRKFSIEYTGKVSEVPVGTKKLLVWMPAPQTTTVQKIEQLEFEPKARLAREPKYGNQIAYWDLANPPSSLELRMKFVCTRQEIRMDCQVSRLGFKITEMPVNHRPRTAGVSKYGFGSRAWKATCDMLAVRWFLSRRHKYPPLQRPP